MIDKSVSTLADAVAGINDGATIMIGGFGPAGQPTRLIDALIEQGARDLTIINNNAGNGEIGLAALLKAGRVRKMICHSRVRLTRKFLMGSTVAVKWSLSWCRRVTWRRAFRRQVPD